MLVAFGLPPLAHEDDAVRGIEAALKVQSQLAELGEQVAIGVTTARVFCGSVGSDTRREYTMIGEGVNLAARLMQAIAATDAVADGCNILCDDETRKAAHREFTKLPPLSLRGLAEPVVVHTPLDVVQRSARTSTSIVGRVPERCLIGDCINRLVEQREGGAILIEAEAGLGKSRLVEYLREQAEELTCLVDASSAIENHTPYLAWRSIFQGLFGLAPRTDDGDRSRQKVLIYLQDFAGFQDLAA
jgi:hypothetical protein